ncbi:ribosome maturation factor RimP [Desulfolithobacter sp.]
MESENNPIIQGLEAYATPLLRDMGLELVEVQYRREGHGWVVRLFIDREGGVTIDDCASVSRQLSAWLDVEDLISHAYNLEVSSPGLERPLKKREDFIRFAGRKARVKLQEPMDGRRVFTGIIDRVEDDVVVLLLDEGPVSLAFDDMVRARLSL